MKHLFILLSVVLLSCSKSGSDPAPGPPSYPHIFWNTNVTVKSAVPVIINGTFYVGVNLVNPTGLTKYELMRADNPGAVLISGTPANGSNQMLDGNRTTLTPTKSYIIRFTRADNTTFQTTAFEV
jgi:hypothetical protein